MKGTLLVLLAIMGGMTGWALEPYLPPSTAPAAMQLQSPEALRLILPDGTVCEPGKFRSERLLNGIWKFSGIANSALPFPAEVDFNQGFEQPGFDDSRWLDMPVPLNWYTKFPEFRQSEKPFVKGWYRRNIDITAAELKQHRAVLHFAVIGYDAVLFVNGREAGRHHGDFTPWEIDVTTLVKPGRNMLAIRVLSDFGPAYGNGISAATHVYGSQWAMHNIKAGIWREVSLSFEPEIRVVRALVNPRLADNSIMVEYWIDNTGDKPREVHFSGIVSPAVKSESTRINAVGAWGTITLVPGENHGTVNLTLKEPIRWSPSHPYLYYLTLKLDTAGKTVSAATVRFGFRDFKTIGNRFYLNGDPLYLFGENIPSVGFGGYDPDPAVEREKLQKFLRDFRILGYNILRTAHMPMDAGVTRYADEIGLMIYNEWGWSFTASVDEPRFSVNNPAEIREWVYRDYNCPSVVMWSGGNEVVFKNSPAVKRQLNQQVTLLRQLDRSGRPVSVFSGSGNGHEYGKDRMLTDVIDMHSYTGLAEVPWSMWSEKLKFYRDLTRYFYSDHGKFNMPYIVWECVGFSWGHYSDDKFKIGDIHDYDRYVKMMPKTGWGNTLGIGYSGTIGLRNGVTDNDGLSYGRSIYGRRILEHIRKDPTIQGFAPWFMDPGLAVARLWTQPVLGALNYPGSTIPPRNFFAGRELRLNFFAVNNSPVNLEQFSVELALAGSDGKSRSIAIVKLGSLAVWGMVNRPLAVAIPADIVSGRYQLRLTLKDGAKEIGRNYYDCTVKSPEILTKQLSITKTVAMIDAGGAGAVQTGKILDALGIKYRSCPPASGEWKNAQLVIIPPAARTSELPDQAALTSWIRRGGILLQLEQSGGEALLSGAKLVDHPNTFVDLCLPEHPVFKGLSPADFDTWNNPAFGFVITHVLTPFSINALAVCGPNIPSQFIGSAVVEASYGKGRIFVSQLDAVRLWGRDGVASAYLRNLLEYLGTQPPAGTVLPLVADGQSPYSVASARVQTIDLRAYANRNFTDWTAQGNDDFRNLKPGMITAAGVPFEIIDPATNKKCGALILRGSQRTQFPESIRQIKLNGRYCRLFFLHACALGTGLSSGSYRINYGDGKSVNIPLKEGDNIGDWLNPSSVPNARLGVTSTRNGRNNGLYVFAWENPFPEKEIKSFDFIAENNHAGNGIDYLAGNSAVPILAGVTGEKIGNELVIGDGDSAGTNGWSVQSHPAGTLKPKLGWVKKNLSPGDVYGGNLSLRVSLPARKGVEEVFLKGTFPVRKLAVMNAEYLSFAIKSKTPGTLDIRLPEKDWKCFRHYTLTIDRSFVSWQKIRLQLKRDLISSGADFPPEELRGELFIFGGDQPVDFLIDDIKFE